MISTLLSGGFPYGNEFLKKAAIMVVKNRPKKYTFDFKTPSQLARGKLSKLDYWTNGTKVRTFKDA